MIWTDLGNPSPRRKPLMYQPVSWPTGDLIFLPQPRAINSLPPLDTVIESRRTQRDFGRLPQTVFSKWLWMVGREMAEGHSDLGFPLTRRPVPSAGAIHPVHLVFSLPEANGWYLYSPEKHALASLIAPVATREQIRTELSPVLDIQEGVAIRLIAEPGKTAAKYENADSLIWRDAGVLLGQMALVAEALAFNFCPLGTTGHEWCAQLELESRLVGVGLAVLGSR